MAQTLASSLKKKKMSDSPDHVSRATPILKYSPGGIYANY